MNTAPKKSLCGFTLIELLAALFIISLLAMMSYRGLGAVLDARTHIANEAEKWRRLNAFMARFEHDIQLAAPRPVRNASGSAPAWLGTPEAHLEFSRFGSGEGGVTPLRLAYRLNEQREIELWLWPGLDVAPGMLPVRHAVLGGVDQFELRYLNADLVWVNAWPTAAGDAPVPRALRLRIVLASGEEIVRVFGVSS